MASIIEAKRNGGGYAEAVALLEAAGYWPLDDPYWTFIGNYFAH